MQQLGNPEIVTYFGSSGGARQPKDAYNDGVLPVGAPVRGPAESGVGEPALPAPEAARLMAQVAAGLRVLHAQTPPVAHRDQAREHPRHGERLFYDFGSAVGAQSVKSQSERSTQEELIEKNTTQMYRAPEMCDLFSLPRNGTLDEAVDIWALGCVFYAMLFLVHPFQVGSVGGSIF